MESRTRLLSAMSVFIHTTTNHHHNEPRLNAVFRFKELNYGYTLVNKDLMIFFSLKN
jgi:hypothetical protein